MTKGDTFGIAIGTMNPGRYTWGFHNLLWQNGANIYSPDLKRAAVADPPPSRSAEFWGALPTQHKVAPPAERELPRRVHRRASSACGSRARGTSPACARPRWTSRSAPLPRLFKQPVVWSMPHQYSFPQAEGRRSRQARRGVGPHALDDRSRRRLDAEGRPGLGHPQGPHRSADHRRSRPQDAARAGIQLAGRAADAQVGRGGERHSPGDREHVHGPEAGRRRRWRTWRARSTRCPTERVAASAPPAAGPRPRTCFWRPACSSSRSSASIRCSRACGSPSRTRGSAGPPRVRRPRQLHAPDSRTRRFHVSLGQHRLLHGGQHAADPRHPARAGASRSTGPAAHLLRSVVLLSVHAVGGDGRADLAVAARSGRRARSTTI